ncbi:MAG: hypothetical protein AABW58_01970 [Nanoarchaeota archaeon]
MTVIEKTETYSSAELYELGKSEKFGRELFLRTTTQVRFNDKNLLGVLKDSNLERRVGVPILNIRKVNSLKNEYYTLAEKFLQTLFQTEDNLEEIVKTLAKLGNIENSNEIIISTPKREYRKAKPDRYVGIYFGKKMLHIDLYTN